MIDAYLATLEKTRRERGEAIDALIRALAPDAEVDISRRMPTWPAIKAGVGCVNFKDSDPFPIDDLKTLVRDALKPSAEILAREAAARGKKDARKKEGQPT